MQKLYAVFICTLLLVAFSQYLFAQTTDAKALKPDSVPKKPAVNNCDTPAVGTGSKLPGLVKTDGMLVHPLLKVKGLYPTNPLPNVATGFPFAFSPLNKPIGSLVVLPKDGVVPDNPIAGAKALLPAGSLLPEKTINDIPKSLLNAGQIPNVSAVNFQNALGSTSLKESMLNGKNQLSKLAALRSQLLTESIDKNLKSIRHASISAKLSVENDFQYQPVTGVITGNKYQEVIGIRGSIVVLGMPLNINLSNNQAAFNGLSPLNSNLFKLGFNPSMLSGLLMSDLQQYAGLKNSVFHGFNYSDFVHQTLMEKIGTLQKDMNSLKGSPLSAYLNDPSKLQALLALPEKQMRRKLDSVADEKSKTDLKQTNPEPAVLQAGGQVASRQADSAATVITAIKTDLNSQGISTDKLLLSENYLTGKTSPTFNASEAAGNLFNKKPGNAGQNFLAGIKDLQIGSFGNQIPGGSGETTKLMNGASIKVKLGEYPFTFGYGGLNDLNSLKDADYQSSSYAYPKNITYIGAEMKRGVFGDVKLSVSSSFNGQSGNAQYGTATLPGNAVAFTLSKMVKTDDFGNISVDVSRSGTLYSRTYEPGSEALIERKAGANSNLNNDLFQSFAVGVTHSLNITKLDASDNVYFNYAGLGYQNPANNGYSGATMKFGGNFKKRFYNKKMTMNFRTDYRSMPLSYTTSDKWKNYQIQFDTHYQMTKTLNLDLKFIGTGTSSVKDGISGSVYNSRKLEIDANDSYKIGGYFTVSHLAISNQSLTNIYASAGSSDLLNLNYVQSLVLKNSTLTGTFFYNRELSAFKMIGDLLTTDMIYQYTLFRKLKLSTGLTYLDNAGIAEQAGIKQGLQVLSFKHFEVNASVDLRRNLITPEYQDFYPACRGDLSIKYYFKID